MLAHKAAYQIERSDGLMLYAVAYRLSGPVYKVGIRTFVGSTQTFFLVKPGSHFLHEQARSFGRNPTAIKQISEFKHVVFLAGRADHI